MFLLYFRIAAQNPKSLCTLVWNQDSGSLADRAVRRGSRSRCWHSFPSHQNMSESLTSEPGEHNHFSLYIELQLKIPKAYKL